MASQAEIDERVRLGDPDPCARGGVCGDCYSCRIPETSDELVPEVVAALAVVGVCVERPESPVIVSLCEWHEGSLGGCWGPR